MYGQHRIAKYGLGQVVRHRYDSIPEDVRPAKDQPFYHLYAETEATYYVAYVSEQNLVPDHSGEPLDHPEVEEMFGDFEDGRYPLMGPLN